LKFKLCMCFSLLMLRGMLPLMALLLKSTERKPYSVSSAQLSITLLLKLPVKFQPRIARWCTAAGMPSQQPSGSSYSRKLPLSSEQQKTPGQQQ
jgi:hypothetical protein